MDCQQQSTTISWEESDLALSYMAYVESPSGIRTHCASTGAETQCEVTQLMCSTVYNVWVKALGLQYNSSASAVLSLTSGEDDAAFIPHISAHSTLHFGKEMLLTFVFIDVRTNSVQSNSLFIIMIACTGVSSKNQNSLRE